MALATASASVRILRHPCIRRKRLALDDADGGQWAHQFGVERRGRFLLHDIVQHLEEREIVGRDGVHHLAAALVEHGRRRRSDPAESGLAAQELGDAGTDTARFVRVDLCELPDRVDRRLRIVVLHEHAPEDQDAGRQRAGNVETALGQRAVVAGRQDQVLPSFAAVRTGRAEVGDPTPPHIVDGAERLGRRLEHHGTLAEIDDADEIHGIRIRRQEQRFCVHQLGEHEHLVVLHADIEKALANGSRVHALHRVHEGFESVREVQVVVDLGEGLLARHAVPEEERADTAIDFVGRRDRRGNCGGGLRRGQPGRCQPGAGDEDGQ